MPRARVPERLPKRKELSSHENSLCSPPSIFHPPPPQPASIHWHGQRQVATSIMDGVVSVTQRPVGGADGATNASTTPPAFLYDFVLREGERGGERERQKRGSGNGALARFSQPALTLISPISLPFA